MWYIFAQDAEEDPRKHGSKSLGFIELSFCDVDDKTIKENELSLEIEQGEKADICIDVRNTSDESITLKLNAVDGAVTIDQTQKRSCKSNVFTEKFGQYIQWYDKLITIPANSQVRQLATLELPLSYVGSFLWCMSYEIFEKEKKKTTWMFEIILRKAKFIDVFVDGDINVGLELQASEDYDKKSNLLKHDKLYFHEQDDGSAFLSFSFHNIWHIDQQSQAKVTITNIFGKEVFANSQDKKTLPGESTRLFFSVAKIPWYRGPFHVYVDVTHRPEFSFDSEKIDASLRQEQSFSVKSRAFLFPWRLIVALVVLYIIFKVIRIIKKKKRDHEQPLDQPYSGHYPQNPQQYSNPYQQAPQQYPGHYAQNPQQYPTGYQQNPQQSPQQYPGHYTHNPQQYPTGYQQPYNGHY